MAHQQARRTSRVWLPAIAFVVFASIVLARLVQVQVLEHDRYAEEARSELFASDTVFARRGAILDRNGFLLAMSMDTWDLYIASRVWNDEAAARTASEAIAEATGHDATYLRTLVRESGLVDVLVARDVPYDTGKALLVANVPGLVGLPNTMRVHPAGDLASSIIGITGTDNTGLTGIEAWYDAELQGTPGRVIFERDTTGSPIPYGETFTTEPVPGPDVVLTIDRRMQVAAERALKQAIEEHEATRGAIIIMDPRNGEILALATHPRLEFNSLDLSDPEQVRLLRNSAVSDVYEPGSVMKVITTAAAIDASLVTPETEYEDTGIAYVYGIPLYNWKNGVYGEQTMTGVLQQSINTGAVFMVEKLGVGLFHEYLDAFGFGRTTGIDMSGEATGIVRRPTDPDWSPVDAATQSFGQAISVTPCPDGERPGGLHQRRAAGGAPPRLGDGRAGRHAPRAPHERGGPAHLGGDERNHPPDARRCNRPRLVPPRKAAPVHGRGQVGNGQRAHRGQLQRHAGRLLRGLRTCRRATNPHPREARRERRLGHGHGGRGARLRGARR